MLWWSLCMFHRQDRMVVSCKFENLSWGAIFYFHICYIIFYYIYIYHIYIYVFFIYMWIYIYVYMYIYDLHLHGFSLDMSLLCVSVSIFGAIEHIHKKRKNYQSKQNFGLKSYWKFMAQKIHGVVRINVCLLYVYVCCAWSLISKIPFRDPKIIQEHVLFDLWVDDMVFCLI